MVTLRLRFVVSDRDRHGNVRYYFDAKARRRCVCTAFLDRKNSWTHTIGHSPRRNRWERARYAHSEEDLSDLYAKPITQVQYSEN